MSKDNDTFDGFELKAIPLTPPPPVVKRMSVSISMSEEGFAAYKRLAQHGGLPLASVVRRVVENHALDPADLGRDVRYLLHRQDLSALGRALQMPEADLRYAVEEAATQYACETAYRNPEAAIKQSRATLGVCGVHIPPMSRDPLRRFVVEIGTKAVERGLRRFSKLGAWHGGLG